MLTNTLLFCQYPIKNDLTHTHAQLNLNRSIIFKLMCPSLFKRKTVQNVYSLKYSQYQVVQFEFSFSHFLPTSFLRVTKFQASATNIYSYMCDFQNSLKMQLKACLSIVRQCLNKLTRKKCYENKTYIYRALSISYTHSAFFHICQKKIF